MGGGVGVDEWLHGGWSFVVVVVSHISNRHKQCRCFAQIRYAVTRGHGDQDQRRTPKNTYPLMLLVLNTTVCSPTSIAIIQAVAARQAQNVSKKTRKKQRKTTKKAQVKATTRTNHASSQSIDDRYKEVPRASAQAGLRRI